MRKLGLLFFVGYNVQILNIEVNGGYTLLRLTRERQEEMARCKAANFAAAFSDCPSSYVYFESNGNSFKRLRAIVYSAAVVPRPEVLTIGVKIAGKKVTKTAHCAFYFSAILVTVFSILLAIKVFPYPLRASCTIQWGFGEHCSHVAQRLRSQILKWTSCSDCGDRGNRCLYSLKEIINRGNDTIWATHLSPNLNFLDDILIIFTPSQDNTCVATAKSTTRAWFVLFDHGTNYCNLRNLVNGAELDADRKFTEATNEAICTQLNTAICS